MLNLLKNKKIINLLLLSFLFLLASCSSTNKNEGTEEITDLVGRNVKIEGGTYDDVVCIGAGALRLYSYIGDSNLLAGVEDIDNSSLEQRPKMFDGVARPYFIANEEAYKTLPSCGIGGPQSQIIEEEKILNCNPDIIISEYEDADKANKLQNDLGIPVIVVSYGADGVFDERIKTSLTILGKAFKREEKATKLISFIENERSLIEAKTKNIETEKQKKVYVMGLGNWGTTNHLMTCQNYTPFNIAHINNVIKDLAKDGIQAIEKEKFEALAPSIDIMIMDAAAVKNIKKLYKEDPTMFDNLKAWNDGEVYLQMAYNAYYTNLEIALCNTWYNAMVVYPDLFKDININDKLNEITKVFLGVELADKINAYPMSYGGYVKVNKETIFA